MTNRFDHCIERLERMIEAKAEELDQRITGAKEANDFRENLRHLQSDICPGALCRQDGCKWTRELIQHNCSASLSQPTDCFECFAMACLWWNHAKHCDSENCPTPWCEEVKDLRTDWLENKRAARMRNVAATLACGDNALNVLNAARSISRFRVPKIEREDGIVLELYDLRAATEKYKLEHPEHN